jgi:hypothetical protein
MRIRLLKNAALNQPSKKQVTGSLIVDSVKYLIECGKRLATKKASLPHGAWLPWLKENEGTLGFTHKDTASRMMRLASNTASTQHIEIST